MVTNCDKKSFGSHTAKKIPKVAQTTGTIDVFLPCLGILDPLRRELPHVQIVMNDGPNLLTWDAQLLSY